MSDAIDVGIDLGTTNSAVSVYHDGEVTVVKNVEGWDFTPSAVWMPSADEILVGRAARDVAFADPENAAVEFKLEMGSAGAERRFATAGVTRTPQQLSAEVLRSLRTDVEEAYGRAPRSAVITVPAAFLLHQNNATGEAAELAGFAAECPLVQEPTAAAFAYGLADRSDRANWLVFDFGGGTFDAAAVSKRGGRLMVVNHAGDRNLGGKLIDWALVDDVLAPAVVAQFGLREFRRDNPTWRINFAKLKGVAETAKIQLSRTERSRLSCSPPLTDSVGRPLPFEYVLTRAELEAVAAPFYRRAIACCRDALAEGNLRPEAIDKVLLVGGVTLAPGLRTFLADSEEGLGIPLDHSQDPRTVVARGAALFAHTVPLAKAPTQPDHGHFAVELDYPRMTASTKPLVAGRLRGAPAPTSWSGFTVVLANPQGRPPFRSGAVAVRSDASFVVDVAVEQGATSRFSIELTDPRGLRRPVDPDALEITHGVEFSGAMLTHSIGIGQADRSYAPILRKGTRLPARGRGSFRTTAALRRSDPESTIRIPVVEGDRARSDRNWMVGTVRIRPVDATIDVPVGSDVDVTLEIDEYRRVSAVADVPLLRQQFEVEADLADVAPPSHDQLRQRRAEAGIRLDSVRMSVGHSGSEDAAELLARLQAADPLARIDQELRAAATDVGQASACEQTLLDLHADLDRIEDALRLPDLLAEVDSALATCRAIVAEGADPADQRELAELERQAATGPGDPGAADALLSRTVQMAGRLLQRTGELDVVVFHTFRASRDAFTRPAEVDRLIAQGGEALASGDRPALQAVNERLRRMWPATEPPPTDSDVERRGDKR